MLLAGLAVLAVKLGLQRVYPQRVDTTGVIRVLADFQYKTQIATIVLDTALVALAYYSAYLLRFEGALEAELPVFSASILTVLALHAVMLGAFGVYQDSWRHAGIRDLSYLAMAAAGGTAASLLAVLAQYPLRGLLAGGVRHSLAARHGLSVRQPRDVPRARRAAPHRAARGPAHDHLRRRRRRRDGAA